MKVGVKNYSYNMCLLGEKRHVKNYSDDRVENSVTSFCLLTYLPDDAGEK